VLYRTHGANATRCDGSKRESDREKRDEMEAKCERQYGILNISASRNPFSFKLRPVFKFITSTTSLIISYRTHAENTTRCDGSNRENDREKDVKVEGDCERQYGILNISASRNPFFFKLRPVFKFITSTTISDHVISYTWRKRNAMRRIK